jgi:hypothetical protein
MSRTYGRVNVQAMRQFDLDVAELQTSEIGNSIVINDEVAVSMVSWNHG